MTFKRRAAIAALALLVSGCGGGGSGSNPVMLAPGGSTPTPTPTPTPAATYLTYGDHLADWTATTPYAVVQYVYKSVAGAPPDVMLSNTASVEGRMLQLDFKGRPSIAASFADFDRGKFVNFSDKDLYSDDAVVGLFLMKDGGSTGLLLSYPRVQASITETYAFKYLFLPSLRYGYASNPGTSEFTTLSYSFIVGDKTKSYDLPKDREWPGYSYHAYMIARDAGPGDPNFPISASGSLDYSPTTGAVSGRLQYTEPGQPKATQLDLTGTVDEQTHRLSGDIVSANGLYAGKFQGDFYGPKGKEVGLLYSVKRQDGGFASAGQIYGAIIVCSNTINGVVGNTVVCG